jgi:hypothetical protein
MLLVIMLSLARYARCRIFYCDTECHYAECRHAECRGAPICIDELLS